MVHFCCRWDLKIQLIKSKYVGHGFRRLICLCVKEQLDPGLTINVHRVFKLVQVRGDADNIFYEYVLVAEWMIEYKLHNKQICI